MQRFDYLVLGAPDGAGVRPIIAERGFPSDSYSSFLQNPPVAPFPDGTGALAILRETAGAFLLLYAHPMRLTVVRVPEGDLRVLKGDLKPLMALIRSDLEQPQSLMAPTRWTFEIRREALYRALEIFDGEMHQLLSLLSGAFTPTGAAVTHFPASFSRRYQLVQGLLMLLPAPLRYLLTFSLNSSSAPPSDPRLIFVQGDYEGQRRRASWGQRFLMAEEGIGQTYVEYLHARWDGDLDNFVRVLMALDEAAYQAAASADTIEAAAEAVIGALLSQEDNQRPPVPTLIALLEDGSLDEDLRTSYLDMLFTIALEDRDATAAHWLAAQMEADPALADLFNHRLDDMLVAQPDAVYAFVRAHLNAGGNLGQWLPRLHQAARAAFDLVLRSGDASSIMSWLQLLAREPEHFAMAAIVHESIVRSIPLAHQNAGLARDLLVRALKRAPDLLDTLLNDTAFQQALAPEVYRALYQHDPQAIADILDQSRELFLLAMARLLPIPNSVDERLAMTLWHVYVAYPTLIVAPPYHPLTLLRQLLGSDRQALQTEALISLLAGVLTDGSEDLFLSFASELAASGTLGEILPTVLAIADYTPDQIVNLLIQLISEGILSAQQVIEVYLHRLDEAAWDDRRLLPIVEHLARLVAQTPEAPIPVEVLWHLIEAITQNRTADSIVRAIVRRLLTTVIEPAPPEKQADDLARLWRFIKDHTAARTQLMQWWATFLDRLTLQQLGRLGKLLQQRALGDLHDSLNTAMGVRRQLTEGDLRQWAEDIATTYRVLRALSEGFDPEKRTGSIDPATLQRLLSAVNDWPSDQKQVLAATLRDLAELLPQMADARTKPTLIRSDDQLERRLMSGELQPQSAIDVMRWLAGFLEGMQKEGL